jgi:hypothetical protein
MKISLTTSLLLMAGQSASAFVPRHQQQRAFVPLRMSDDAPATKVSKTSSGTGGALVPIKEETVEFTAGILGGAAGFLLGGPILAAIGAATANYISKLDGEPTDVVQAVSKSTIQVYNYLTTLDQKYEVLNKAKSSLSKALDKLKNQDSVDAETVAKVESALASTTSKINEINDEYDLVGGATTALGVIGDLVEKAIKKAGELNEEYQLTDKALGSLQGAVAKAKEAAKQE